MALAPTERIAGLSFLVDIDWRKDKLVAIVEACESLFTWWAHQPQGAPLPAYAP